MTQGVVRMKIISWNCNMAYRNKEKILLKFNPDTDIVVVPECEKFGEQTSKRLWFGDNPKKGLGIFSYSDDYQFELSALYDANFKYIVLIKIEGTISFNLLAVWTKNDERDKNKAYTGQAWAFINKYKDDIFTRPTIIIGDFNCDKKLEDKTPWEGVGMTKIWDYLLKRNIDSVYHKHFNLGYGQEKDSTFFHIKKQDRPFHIDWCFASEDFLSNRNSSKVRE